MDIKNKENKISKVYLIRIGIDSSSGGFVAPYFIEESDILYIPLYNEKGKEKNPKSYETLKTNNPTINLLDFFPKDQIYEGNDTYYELGDIVPHYDPEFVTNTYGEAKKKCLKALADFKEGDYVLFYGAFFPTNKDSKFNQYTIKELKKIQLKKKQYYIFAFLRLKYPPIRQENYYKYLSEIKNNAHILRGDFKQISDILVLKGDEKSGYIKPIRIDNGELKGRNYQMNDFLYQYKLCGSGRGLNRCYCKLSSEIIPKILVRINKPM